MCHKFTGACSEASDVDPLPEGARQGSRSMAQRLLNRGQKAFNENIISEIFWVETHRQTDCQTVSSKASETILVMISNLKKIYFCYEKTIEC